MAVDDIRCAGGPEEESDRVSLVRRETDDVAPRRKRRSWACLPERLTWATAGRGDRDNP